MRPVRLKKFFHVSGEVMIELRPVQTTPLKRINRDRKKTIAVVSKKPRISKKK